VKILATQSPRHAWYAHPKLNPDYRAEEKAEFDYGTAAHALFLEGSESNLVVVAADDWRTKAAREAREQARAEGKTPILERQLTTIRKMVQAAHKFVESSPYRMKVVSAEQKIKWREGGAVCIAKLDRLSQGPNGYVIVDYKSTTDAEPEAFSRQIARMGYDLQDRWYQRGFLASQGEDAEFLFLAQETDPPYCCSWHALAPSMEEIADMRIARAISVWQRCMASGEWPGYSNQIHYAEAPHWQLEVAEQLAEVA